MIGIIGAMQQEVNALKDMVINPAVQTISGMDFCSGQLF